MIEIDFTNMIGTTADGGISEAEWNTARSKFSDIHASLKSKIDNGEVGFPSLPAQSDLLEGVLNYAQGVKGRYTDIVLLGIGGSALGPRALAAALSAGGRLPTAGSPSTSGAMATTAIPPRFHIIDNIDPDSFERHFSRFSLRDTLFVVISKSGGTAETMSQMLIVYDKLEEVDLNPRYHLVFVTDPTRGALRKIAALKGIAAFPVPENIGGRFSVLSPVGTLSAALLGLDVRELLKGAAAMADRCSESTLAHNPAAVFATLQYLADTEYGCSQHVLMPYSDGLRDFAHWFVQLWSESLGKLTADGRHSGPTPVPAVGASDQHSQVQLFMEGPANKTVSFIAVKEHAETVPIPSLFRDIPELAYLGGHSLSKLINIEHRATAGALAKRGRLNMTIGIDRLDAWHLGGLIMMFEFATAYAGELYQVNAYNQPGVELGKNYTYAMLGKPGDNAAKKEWESLSGPDPRWSTIKPIN